VVECRQVGAVAVLVVGRPGGEQGARVGVESG